MELSVSHQAYVFVCMVLCGMLSGIIFDIFRSIRRCTKPKSCIIAAQDLFFWFIELCVVYITAFEVNNAQIRGYEAIALVLGAVFYFVTVSEYVMRFLCHIIRFAMKTVNAVLKPLYKILHVMTLPFKKARSAVKKKAKNIKNRISSLVKNEIRRLKTIFSGKIQKY